MYIYIAQSRKHLYCAGGGKGQGRGNEQEKREGVGAERRGMIG